MANISFTVPDPVLNDLDAFARDKGFSSFRDYISTWVRDTYTSAKVQDNRRRAAQIASAEPQVLTITVGG